MPSVTHAMRRALKPLRGPLYWAERQLYSVGILSLDRLTLPNFLGLGAPQSGTTWLFENLLEHPDVFVADKKECHYFTLEFHKWPLRYYASLFAEGADKVRGEITPGYNVLRHDRIEYVRKIMPDVRLILLIRNPVDRAWSSARRQGSRMAKHAGSEFDEIDDALFFEYFRTEGGRARERVWNYQPGVFHGHYCQQIDAWTRLFPEEQLLVGFFDEISKNPKALMTRVCEHIGARTDIDWESMPLSKVVNKNPEHPMPERFRSYLQDLYSPEIERLYRRFGEPIAAWR